MQQEYLLLSGVEPIGKVIAHRQGLYYRIQCRCQLTGMTRNKLMAHCGKNTVDLGLCVPMGDGFGIDTRIPIKRLGEGTLEFQLVPKYNFQNLKFIQVMPNAPFAYIRRLQHAHLAIQDGHVGVILNEN